MAGIAQQIPSGLHPRYVSSTTRPSTRRGCSALEKLAVACAQPQAPIAHRHAHRARRQPESPLSGARAAAGGFYRRACTALAETEHGLARISGSPPVGAATPSYGYLTSNR